MYIYIYIYVSEREGVDQREEGYGFRERGLYSGKEGCIQGVVASGKGVWFGDGEEGMNSGKGDGGIVLGNYGDFRDNYGFRKRSMVSEKGYICFQRGG